MILTRVVLGYKKVHVNKRNTTMKLYDSTKDMDEWGVRNAQGRQRAGNMIERWMDGVQDAGAEALERRGVRKVKKGD